MRISENPSFESYCCAYIGLRRDAIYRYDLNANGEWFDNGYGDHGPPNEQGPKDKGGRHALTSTEFVHFGSRPRDLRFELAAFCHERGLRVEGVVAELVHPTQGQSKYCSRQA
jgi:hypothetical protein